MVSFEYKVITTDRSFWSGKEKTDIEPILNDMGRDGWDLVSVVPVSSAGAGTTTNLRYFFKRQRF
jgi:hypothetical protein